MRRVADAARQFGDVEQHHAPVAGAHGELAEQGLAGDLVLVLFARLLALGAVQNVRLGDLVQPVLDQVLLDDVLDVLDVGVQLGEAGVDLAHHGRHHRAQGAVLERVPLVGWGGSPNRLRNSDTDPVAVEVDDLAGPLDDHLAHVPPRVL